MKNNYDKLMLQEVRNLEEKEDLLLHICCAPCASYCIKELSQYFNLKYLFYNPNIESKEEFDKRLNELKKYLSESGYQGEIIAPEYNHDEFLEFVKGLEDEPERGKRCKRCFYLRLNKAKEIAEKDDERFATTLTLSPLKNSQLINQIGLDLSEKYLVSDFKKRNGYLESINLSKQYNLYRQNYCGCEFSKRGQDGS